MARAKEKSIKASGSTDELFEKIEKYLDEKFFFYYVISCMILIPICEFITELFGVCFVSQPLILIIYGYVGLIVCLLRIIGNFKKKKVCWHEIFYLTLLGFAGISLAFSSDIDNSFSGWDYDELPAHFLAYFSLMYSGFQIKSNDLRKKVLYVFMTLAFFEGIIGILQSFEIKIEEVMYGPTTVQVYGLTQNTNFFGGLSVIFVGVSSGAFIFFDTDKKKRILLGILYAISMYCSFNSMARLAWVGDIAIIFFLVISILIMRYREKKCCLTNSAGGANCDNYEMKVCNGYLVRWLIVILITFGVLIFSFLHSDEPMGRVAQSLDEIDKLQENNTDDFGSLRGYIWRYVLESVPKHWATGIGLDNLRMCFMENPTWEKGMYFQDKAHNEYIHTLATQGVFAFINYLALLIISAVIAIKRIIHTGNDKERIITWVFLTMFTGYMAQAMFNSSIINVAMYFWIVIGLLNPAGRREMPVVDKVEV